MLKINAFADGDVELMAYGPIGGYPDEGGICARDVAAALQGKAPRRISLRINSPGGDAFEGIAIYNLLKSHPARVEVMVDAMAASAASIVAMAGDDVRMADNALMMVHDPWAFAVGSADDLRSKADVLDKTADMIARTYAAKCGKSPEEMRKLMAVETWLTAEEAFELGLVNMTTEPEQIAACAMPPAFLERFRNMPSALLEAVTSPSAGRAPAPENEMNITPALIHALALQDSADEPAVMAAIGQLQARAAFGAEVEAITGNTGPEALGTVKAWKQGAAERDKLAAAKTALELEGHKRDFAAALADGRKDSKLTPATEQHFQKRFDAAENKADHVSELRAFLAVAPRVLPQASQEPQGVSSGALLHEGKTFAQLSPMERHNLNNSNPELYRAMRNAARGAQG